ncbi:hypothetical protein AN958_01718 [Leucoagaricus sp. SymC.cos]|nr:hypothetical protein AN958_01718 [Leucoagaricus sp. SymC.cos]
MFSVILLGLTGYRTHYTKQKSTPDILTTRNHFWTPIVVELLVVGILGTIFSLWMIFALLAKIGRGPLGTNAFEHLWLITLFVMSLVGAGIVTREFSNLQWCRHLSRQCRVLEAIKSFSWIFWGFTIFLIAAAAANIMRNKHGFFSGPVHGRRDTLGSYPETRTVSHGQPVTTSAVPTTERTGPLPDEERPAYVE